MEMTQETPIPEQTPAPTPTPEPTPAPAPAPKPASAPAPAPKPAPTPTPVPTPVSHFDGRTIQLIGWRLLGLLLSAVTLGIGTPWAMCMIYRWETRHTLVEGKRLYFDGKGIQLLGKLLLWGLLIVITLGIYIIFLPVSFQKWKASHIHFDTGEHTKQAKSGSGWAVVAAILAVLLVLSLAGIGTLLYMNQKEKAPSYDPILDNSLPQQIIIQYGDSNVHISQNTGSTSENPITQLTSAPPADGSIVGSWMYIGSCSGSRDETVEVVTFRFLSNGTFEALSRQCRAYTDDNGTLQWSVDSESHTADIVARAAWCGTYTYDGYSLGMHYRYERRLGSTRWYAVDRQTTLRTIPEHGNLRLENPWEIRYYPLEVPLDQSMGVTWELYALPADADLYYHPGDKLTTFLFS